MNFLKLLYRQYPLLSLGIFSSIIFLAHLDVLPVTIMEARNFITAREMLTHSNWIFTTLNNMPRYEKPPLPTWLTAISASLFGINSLFALRLPAAISAILLNIFSYKSALKLGASKLVSFFTGLTLATSFYVVFSGRSGQWDIFTHSFMMLAIYCLLKVFTKPTGQKWGWSLLGGVMFGFSLLSKGPVSLYTLFLPFIFSYFTVFRMENLKTQILKLIVFLITGIILGTWWSVVVRYFDPRALLSATDVESSRWFNYSVRPFYYYWSFFTQSGIWTVPALLGLAYWYLKDRVSNFKVYQFYFFWTIGSLILLSIIPEKKSRYLLPVLIPLAATTAFYLEFLLKNFHPYWKKIEKLPILIYFALLEIVCLAAPLIVFLALKNDIWQHTFWFLSFSILIVSLGIWGIHSLIDLNIKKLISLPFLMIIVIISFGFPVVRSKSSDPGTKNIETLKHYSASENIQIYDATGVMPELVFEYGKEIPLILSSQDLKAIQKKRFGILVNEEFTPNYKAIFKDFNLKFIDSIDLNPVLSKNENKRLVRKLYLATAK